MTHSRPTPRPPLRLRRRAVPQTPGRPPGPCDVAELASASLLASRQPCLPSLTCPRVAAEEPSRRELAELVTHHRLADEHRHVLAAVMHGDRVANHLREDRRRA